MRIQRKGGDFEARIGRYTVQMKDRVKGVWKQSIIQLVDTMQARVPVRTGFLRSSLMASTAATPIANLKRPGNGPFAWDRSQVTSVINSLKVGQKVFIAYRANYTKYAENGTAYYPGHGFQRLAVQSWPSIVASVEASY